MDENTYKSLQALANSDFQVVSNEPNVIGWKVKTELGAYIGKVQDLLFDSQTFAVRYLVIDLLHMACAGFRKFILSV
ncbi:PRC-barrel domain-containing protein [Pedobacter steynii]